MVLSRQLNRGYKTAWFLAQRIRNLMSQEWDVLKGFVEVDETYLGGKRTTKPASKRDQGEDQPKGRGGSRKRIVVVAVERGKARAKRGGTHGGTSRGKRSNPLEIAHPQGDCFVAPPLATT
jgi:hypothetical protein